MTWVTGFAGVLGWGCIALLAVAAGAARARKWPFAVRSARACALVALGLVVGSIFVLLVGMRSPAFLETILKDAAGTAPDPSQRARVLAQTISELMNATALGIVAGIVAVPIWLVARRRVPKA